MHHAAVTFIAAMAIVLEAASIDGRQASQQRPRQQQMPPQPFAQQRLAVPSIAAGNTATPVSPSEWQWTIYVMADNDTLGRISCVTYLLHPTFSPRTRRSCERGALPGKGYALTTQGWGTFTVGLTVDFKDGSQQLLTHALSFQTRAEGWAPLRPGGSVTLPVTAVNLRDGDFAFTMRVSNRNGALAADSVEIAVKEDGSTAGTRWTFEILLDEQPWLRIPSRTFNDRQGPVRITGASLVSATFGGFRPTNGSTIRVLGYR